MSYIENKSRSLIFGIQLYFLIFSALSFLFVGVIFDFWAFGFFAVIILSGYILAVGYFLVSPSKAKISKAPVSTVKFNLAVCAISVFGLLLLWIDRTVIRDIQYLDVGIASARAQLNREGERGGLISVFGNLFSVIIYLPLVNLIFDWERWGKGRLFVATGVAICIGGLVYLTAGRTVVLIALALVASAFLGRSVLDLPRLPTLFTPVRLLLGSLGILFLFGYIFALRATAFGVSNAGDYLSQICIHLSQPATEIMSQCPSIVIETFDGYIGDIINYAIAVLIYIFHVTWIGDVIIADSNFGSNTSFAGAANLFLGRFGYTIGSSNYDGYFIPAAHGLIFDYGYAGMTVGFIFLGFTFGLSQRMLQAGKILIGRIAFCNVAAIIFLSVLISGANLPFLMLSQIAILLIFCLAKVIEVLNMRLNNQLKFDK